MKKLLLMMVAIMTVTMASAQDEQMRGQRPRGPRMDRTEMMTKEYNLTKEQQEKVKALNEDTADRPFPPSTSIWRRTCV